MFLYLVLPHSWCNYGVWAIKKLTVSYHLSLPRKEKGLDIQGQLLLVVLVLLYNEGNISWVLPKQQKKGCVCVRTGGCVRLHHTAQIQQELQGSSAVGEQLWGGGKPSFWLQTPQQCHKWGARLGLRMSIMPVGQRVTLWDRTAPFGLAGSALPMQTYKACHARAC